MLASLHIENMAIIASVSLEFSKGFTVLTGETGAGKTVLLSSLGLLQGEPSNDSMIREGADSAFVEASFTNLSLQLGEENFTEITLRRELNRNKPSICRMNGIRVPQKTFKQLKSALFHSVKQHEGHALASESYQRALLDHFDKTQIAPIKTDYKKVYETYKACETELSALTTKEEDQDAQLEFLSFQIEDIEKQRFGTEEEAQLKQQKSTLKSQAKLGNKSNEAIQALQTTNTQLAIAEKALLQLSELDETLTPSFQAITPVQVACRDLEETLLDKQHQWQSWSGGDLNTIESRLDTIFRYKSKYKTQTLPQLLEKLADLKQKQKNITQFDETKAQLTADLETHKTALTKVGKTLYEARKKAAGSLAQTIESELSQLNFQDPKINLQLTFTPETITADGQDTLQFLIAPNIGFSPLPLEKIASGGERSRILLVLQSILQDQNETDTLIFDEIDTGVGGMTAHSLAEKLKAIAKDKQVITITHLSQIAEKADHHFFIQKGIQSEKTTTTIHLLETTERRVKEFQRMAGKHEK